MDVTAYYTDGSYVEVSTPQIGDVIAYFDDKGTPTYYGDDYLSHSGIITQLLTGTSNNVCGNANLFMVCSKWGPGGLYEHRGDRCHEAQNCAEYLRFYRKTHTHSYTYSYAQYPTSPMLHKAYCDCGDYILESHSFTIFSSIYAICGHCGYQAVISKSNGQ